MPYRNDPLHLDTYLDNLYEAGEDPIFIEVDRIGYSRNKWGIGSKLPVPLFLSWN